MGWDRSFHSALELALQFEAMFAALRGSNLSGDGARISLLFQMTLTRTLPALESVPKIYHTVTIHGVLHHMYRVGTYN